MGLLRSAEVFRGLQGLLRSARVCWGLHRSAGGFLGLLGLAGVC